MRTTCDLAPLQGSTIGLDTFFRDTPEAIKPCRIAIAGSAGSTVRQMGARPAAQARTILSSSTNRLSPTASTAVEVIYPRRKPMAIKDLIPWNNRGREIGVHRGAEAHPFLTLHREMNRMFDDVFRGFDLAPFASARAFDGLGWPQIDVDETDKELRITAELPGLDEKDVSLEIANGVLSISGEKKSETEDKDRRFSERYYGRFERRIPLEDVEEGKALASFKNGILTVTIPKSGEAKQNVRRIPINQST
jgi:HSP20 family protein